MRRVDSAEEWKRGSRGRRFQAVACTGASSRRSLAAAVVWSVAAVWGPTGAWALTRYVSPAGSPSDAVCDAGTPCEIHHAIQSVALPNDEVIVLPGDYAISSPITVSKALDIHGADGQRRPRLTGSPAPYLLHVTASGPAAIRHVEVEQDAGESSAVDAGGPVTLDDLIVTVTGGNGTGIVFRSSGGVLRDSVVSTTGATTDLVSAAVLVDISDAPAARVALRNVTAIGSGPTSTGVGVRFLCPPLQACNAADSVVSVRNTIARGRRYDLSVQAAGGGVTLEPSYSNYDPTATFVFNAGVLLDGGHNQSAVPLFVDPSEGDFHQLAGSPTIDAGTTDALTGTTDIDGDARLIGAAPDIGADEFVPSAPDDTAPVGSDLVLSPSRFAPDVGSPPSASLRSRRQKGATATYEVSEAATVTFTVERKVGRRRYKVVTGSFSRAATAGANSFHFTGFVDGKALKPGRYRLTGVPIDGAGNIGAVFAGSFTILRRH